MGSAGASPTRHTKTFRTHRGAGRTLGAANVRAAKAPVGHESDRCGAVRTTTGPFAMQMRAKVVAQGASPEGDNSV